MAETPVVNRLTFNPSPASLKTILIKRIAINYAYNGLNRDSQKILIKDYFLGSDWYWANRAKFQSDFQAYLDEALRQKIADSIHFAVSSLDTWLMKHSYYVFKNQSQSEYLLKLMQDFVWDTDGYINYIKTAEKLISGTKLSPVEKYAMMCLYCMEDDIRRMYDSYDWVEDILETEEFQNNVFVYYWDRVLNDEEAEHSDEDDNRSFEKLILDNRPGNISALKYFFDQLEEGERYDFGIGVLPTMPARYVKAILPKFTESELQRIFDKCLDDYMENIATDSDSKLHPLELWDFAKTFIRGKIFFKMMLKIFQSDDVFEDGYPNWWGDFGLDMWRNTPARLKQLVFRQQRPDPMYAFILKWNTWYSEATGKNLRDDTALLLILSDASAEYRRSFWMKEWSGLIMNSQPRFLIQLMNLCLSGPQEVDEFKGKILSSTILRKHLSNVSNRGYFFDLGGV